MPGYGKTPVVITKEYGDAFVQAELNTPDVDRMLHAFKHPDMAKAVITFLPRYFSPRLVEPARKLLRDPAHQAGAISGLISLLDTTAETRTFIRDLLRSPSPMVRGRAAEFLCWFGEPDDIPYLTKQLAAEKDIYSRAAIVEAAAAIKRRVSFFQDGPVATIGEAAPPSTFGPGLSHTKLYRQLVDALAEPATLATRAEVIRRLRGIEACEPITRYSDRLQQAERGAELLQAHRLLAGYPAGVGAADAGDAPVAGPLVARSLIPPVRDYFDPLRKSYGLRVSVETGGPFGGKVHVGDDAAWHVDEETVVSVGDGIVRNVDLGLESWGGLVVIEHQAPDGSRFCSLYGHLGPLVCVRPGQAVKQGDKLGAVGISYSFANGGYFAHLHFGIHRGAFLLPDQPGATIPLPDQPDPAPTATVTKVNPTTADVRLPDGTTRTIDRRENWVCGYLTPAEFDSATHAWTDPQEFLRKFK